MPNLKAISVILALVAVARSANPPAPAQRPATAKSSARPAKSEAEIEKAIQAKFAKSKIGVEKYQVRVQGGVATIEGKTDVVQHKGVATRLAKSGGGGQLYSD